ncbi:hypothetical protein BpHYR1_004048 [Brachionus plicatilis]|uniref:Uncharacterized protein n=1 Tax=Brachionus plicatilis TaxID=10195 RepID=A0A3M7RS22_BRAPC|nr:hypothetical protein BpHYR1_004048 [Brachionus plicatilis]
MQTFLKKFIFVDRGGANSISLVKNIQSINHHLQNLKENSILYRVFLIKNGSKLNYLDLKGSVYRSRIGSVAKGIRDTLVKECLFQMKFNTDI